MAGWIAGAGLLADGLFGKDAETYTPWQQAAAQWGANPNQSNYFGSTEFITDDMGTPKHYRDDKRTVQQTMSPQMQALADKMMGMAGRGRETFRSGRPGGLMEQRMAQSLGPRQSAVHQRPQYGFGQGTGPAQVAEVSEEVPAENYDMDSYNKIMEALAKSRGQYGVNP